MQYSKIVKATFKSRPNRFIAKVEINNKEEVVHVKNTGRCKELLIEGCTVFLEESDNPNRKTKYDLIAVIKPSTGALINIDSQAPNKVVKEYLEKNNTKNGYDYIKPEYNFGDSRIDFYMEKEKQKYLMEVKGCTLEKDGIGYFPDAPTERGVKHLRELSKAVKKGYNCAVAFVIQLEGVSEVRPNVETHLEFGEALEEAKAAGVNVIFFKCAVTPEKLEIVEEIIQ
ncbi:sugar fermentation stimulation protein A [Lachnospiraceae bacterium C7]|nr:sugar fermentation stimulation protein A [Lachnospiraceae bacterium C7]